MEGRSEQAYQMVKPAIANESLPKQVRARLAAIAYDAYSSTDRSTANLHAQFIESCLEEGVAFVEEAVYVRQIVAEYRLAIGDRQGAIDMTREAERMIRDYAAQLEDPKRVAQYLEDVPENARVLELARELGLGNAPAF